MRLPANSKEISMNRGPKSLHGARLSNCVPLKKRHNYNRLSMENNERKCTADPKVLTEQSFTRKNAQVCEIRIASHKERNPMHRGPESLHEAQLPNSCLFEKEAQLKKGLAQFRYTNSRRGVS